MTTATAERKSLKAREQAAGKLIEKADDSGKILQRLLFYMAGEKARPKFIGALILRILRLIRVDCHALPDGRGDQCGWQPHWNQRGTTTFYYSSVDRGRILLVA